METAEQTLPNERKAETRESPRAGPARSLNGQPVRIEPDLDFIRMLHRQGGDSLKRCFQCGTCSATCEVSPDPDPFPRKEMAWATWGMKARLLEDPDIWLCYQCNDCSVRCPRGARPGDVLGALRQQCVQQFAVPRFLGRWAGQPHCIPLLLGIAAALLTLALAVRRPIEAALGLTPDTGENIVFAYSSFFPHWLLNTFFGLFSVLALLAIVAGIRRYWQALAAALPESRLATPAKRLYPSIVAMLRSVITHERFTLCTQARTRFFSHVCVFFGFIALALVSFWVVTARYNPLVPDDFVYPFGFWYPWKMLANLGGLAVVAGCLLMMRDRFQNNARTGSGSYFDWALIATLLLVVLSGFVTEVLHYLRLEPHRHIAYFVHLVFVFAVLMYLPYSKLAHLFYRATALVFAEHIGRIGTAPSSGTNPGQDSRQEGQVHGPDTTPAQ